MGIDAIELSGGTFTGKYSPCRPKSHEAYHLPFARELTQSVDVPIILVGGLKSVKKIEEILSTTDIQAVAMSRPLIREPFLINRWKEGDTKDAICISCNGCLNPNGT